MSDPDPLPDPSSDPSATPLRPSGLPYPLQPPSERDDLPDAGPGAPASWGFRAGARLFDLFLIYVISVTLAGIFGVKTTEDGTLVGPLWPLFIFPVLFMLYETVLIGRGGQTGGKFLFRIRVVDWNRGGLASYQQAAIRALLPGVFLFGTVFGGVLSLLLLVPIAIYLSSLANPVYRGWHDRTAGTIVLASPWAKRSGEAS